MPSNLHETLVDLFRVQPRMAAEMLDGPLGQELPAFDQARTESGELTELAPTRW